MGLLSAVAGLSAIFGVDNVARAEAHPSDIIDMTPWKLQYATSGDMHEVYPIGTFEKSPYFKDVNGRVQFRAYCDGGTTSGSQYPRSELREMNSNGSRVSSSTSGPTSTLRVTMAVTHTPVVQPRVAYFKTGAYVQSNTQRGDQASAYGEVRIKRVT